MAKNLSSRLFSTLPFCGADGLFGTCFLTLGSSTLCRGTQGMQQHLLFKSFPWCHLPLTCSSESQLSSAFLRFLSPPSSFTTKQSWAQLGGIGCSSTVRPCWGTGTTLSGPSLPCQHQTKPSPLTVRHHHPNKQRCWTWQTWVQSPHLANSKQECKGGVPFNCLVGDKKHLWGLCGQF